MSMETLTPGQRLTAKLVLIGLGLIVGIILVVALMPFKQVESTEVGLKFTWGALQEQYLTQGLRFRWPIAQEIKTVTLLPLQLDYRVAVGPDGAISTDNQTIGADTIVFYRYNKEGVVGMWKNYGEEKIRSIMMTNLRESFKAVIGKYNIFALSVSQDEIKGKVKEDLIVRMEEYPITVIDVNIVNYDWSDAFDAQIAETMSRAQQVKQKEQEKLMAEQEAQKGVVQAEAQKKIAITTAEGQKQAMITQAEGQKEKAKLEAEAKALEGEGIRKYNESVAKNWEIELKKMELNIELQRVEKWNGQYVPNNMYGPIPFDSGGVQGR
ncbi:SPFH domain-containing protein [Candidatus Magnetobacterium casense]|uniref:Band 7 domain-containing protein n=1 Tax=Candidatus Magnetobacterium casense TaxID=1455061 RepID=A0ABS6RU16_9BACT|nr:SPFH domain-containing protein [Candidatus Magnetobacterium casensis]MBV6340122.1 hypothetical protein [Candidatus Magnetobacterium casensis]